MQRLPAEYREILLLREVEDLSYKEIATVTGVRDRHGDVAPVARPGGAAQTLDAAGSEGDRRWRVIAQDACCRCLADGELGPPRRWLLSRHVARCGACAATMEELQAMRAALRTKLDRHRAPPDAGRTDRRRAGARAPLRPARRSAVAAGVARVCRRWSGRRAGRRGADAPGGADARWGRGRDGERGDRQPCPFADGAAPDGCGDQRPAHGQAVAVGAAGRVAAGARTGGARVSAGRRTAGLHRRPPAAAVVYRHAQHVINLFAWASPGQPDAPIRTETRQGFNLVNWRTDGITFWAVSDLEADQLGTFARLVRGG